MADFNNAFAQALLNAVAVTNATRIAASKLPLTDAQIVTALVPVVQTQLNSIP
jgi:hypothetical protein